LGVVDKEDVLDYPYTCSFAVIINGVLIPDLDMEALVLKILGDYYNLLLLSKFPSFVCFSAEVVILLFSKY
jgi:hypothetical protein